MCGNQSSSSYHSCEKREKTTQIYLYRPLSYLRITDLVLKSTTSQPDAHLFAATPKLHLYTYLLRVEEAYASPRRVSFLLDLRPIIEEEVITPTKRKIIPNIALAWIAYQ